MKLVQISLVFTRDLMDPVRIGSVDPVRIRVSGTKLVYL